MTKSEICPSCQQETAVSHLHSEDRTILQCRICGLMFVANRPSTDEIRAFFADEYITTDEQLETGFSSWRQATLEREADILESFFPNGARLLDVGIASGVFASQFAGKERWHVEGVEPSGKAVEAARRRFGYPIHAGFLEDVGFDDASFDVITYLDTFYFVTEPLRELAEVARLLRPGGMLVVEIPGLNFRLLKNTGPLCRLIYGVPVRLNAGVHLFYYSRKTLGKLVEQFGFYEVAAFPEQAPIHGPLGLRLVNHLHFALAGTAYRLTGGKANLAAKEFLIYKKGNG